MNDMTALYAAIAAAQQLYNKYPRGDLIVAIQVLTPNGDCIDSSSCMIGGEIHEEVTLDLPTLRWPS